MPSYQFTETGFTISIDMTVYARPAVMKAMYRYSNEYMISFERKDDHLIVGFESRNDNPISKDAIAEIINEMTYQMVRYDTMNQTKGIRELLVARALYATCIEDEAESSEDPTDGSCNAWREDREQVFKSWTRQEQ